MHPTPDNQSTERLVQSYGTLAYRLQNLLPARSHDMDAAIFASHMRAQLVQPPELTAAVDFT